MVARALTLPVSREPMKEPATTDRLKGRYVRPAAVG
jgi:hypothetical protein